MENLERHLLLTFRKMGPHKRDQMFSGPNAVLLLSIGSIDERSWDTPQSLADFAAHVPMDQMFPVQGAIQLSSHLLNHTLNVR